MDLFYKRSLKPSVLDYSLTRPHSAENVEGTIAENFRAAANQMFSSGSSGSMGNVLYDAYAPILSHVNKTLKENDIKTENFSKGGFFSNEKDYAGIRNELLHNPAYLMSKSASPLKGYLGKEKHYYSKADALIKTIKDHPDLFPEMQDLTVKEIEKQAIASALKDQATLTGITENSPGFSKMMARFAGGMYQAAQDPPIALSMLLSFDPKLALPKVMLREALVGVVSEGIVQERVYNWYKELGLDYSFQDFAQAVATGGVLGFVMPGGLKIGEKTIKMSADWIKRGLDVLGVGQKKLSPIGEGAKELEESINDLANSNPIQDADLPSNKGKHESNLETAKNQLLNNEIVETKPITPDELSDVELNKQVNPDNDQTVFQFNPDEIQVDAKTFQFKEGGDAFGVTSKLRDTKKWDARAAGTITVFERLDGTKFVADGHQRLGLAKRLMSEDPSQNIKMNAFVMREADGITSEFAMVSAAVTNIIRGTGTDLDAAKIYRSNQNLIQTQFADIVPPSSAMFKKAQDLSKLSDENWGMVKNEVIPSDFAAVVGRVIPDDPAIQKAAISVLSRSKVDNAFQAEAIARQVKANEMDTSVQSSLFGDEVEVESLVVERAKVLDEAKRIIRKDRSAFNTLVKNSKEFEKGGNQLNELGNKKKVLDDGTMLAMLMASADKKGEISNALTQAAREGKATNRYGQAARSYVEALRRGIEKGDFDSTDFGSSGRSIDLEKDVRDAQPNPQQQAEIERFDNPGSPAAKEQADQLEEEFFPTRQREGFQSDIDLRKDLSKRIDEGASETEIDTHPAVTKAIEDAMAIPETTTKKGYGTEKFESEREFIFGTEKVIGYENAIDRLYESAKDLAWGGTTKGIVKQQKKAVVVLGAPAAGKSSIADPIARKMNAAIIDPDEAKKVLPEYKGGIGANAVHEESSDIIDRVLQLAVGIGDNIVIPKVGGKASSIRNLVNKLKEQGYDVNLVDMKVSYSEARKRMFKRFIDKGRLINPDYVRQVGSNPTKTYYTLKEEGIANGYTQIDNNGKFDDPKPVLEDTQKLLEGVDIRLRQEGRDGDSVSAISKGEKDDLQASEEEVAELDENLEIPFNVVDNNGNESFIPQSVKSLKDEFIADKKVMDRLDYCTL